jgi:hypothetical protein
VTTPVRVLLIGVGELLAGQGLYVEESVLVDVSGQIYRNGIRHGKRRCDRSRDKQCLFHYCFGIVTARSALPSMRRLGKPGEMRKINYAGYRFPP